MRRWSDTPWAVVLSLTALALGCAPEPTTAETAAPTARPSPPVAPPAPPPPPGPVAYGEALDAALAGPVPLNPTLAERWRDLQAHAGNTLPLLGEGEDLEPIITMLSFYETLASHGVLAEDVQRETAERLQALLVDLAAGRWTGTAAPDRMRMLRLIEAEHHLVHLWSMVAHQFAADRPHPPARRAARQSALLRSLARWPVSALLETLAPATPDYDRLRERLVHYRGVAAAGGWVPVERDIRRARPEKTHPSVVALKRRLAQEDPLYTPAVVPSPTWDEDLSAALARARAAYQLPVVRKARKRPDKKLLKALAVPIEDRIGALVRNLDRLRRSPVSDHPFQVYVNIADYHGEVRDGPSQLHRFRVVVGSSRGRPGRMKNATPTLSARIHRIVYNPWWVVPKRIAREELIPKAEAYAAEQPVANAPGAEEPRDYWKQHGYVVHEDGPDVGFLRRRPGWGNPLGKVKFLFENRHFVFLHDTPQKGKFRSTRRAFSHGCVRVQDPLDLAEILLTRDGSWALATEARVMSHRRETPIDLREPIPVILEYLTARVDADGRAHFLHDLYGRDRPQVAGR